MTGVILKIATMTIFKLTILSISILIIMAANVVSPVLADISHHYRDVHFQLIKMIITLPALLIVPFSFLTGPLIKRFEKKYVVMFGITGFLIGGVGGGLVDNFYSMLMFRAILGACIGILSPLSISLIADFFCDAEKLTMMGYSSAANNLGAGFAAIAAGYLAAYHWRYAFFLYTFAIFVLMLVFFLLPKSSDWNKSEEPACLEAQVPKAGRNIIKWAGFTFLILIIFFSIPTHLDIFIFSENLGTSATTGILIGLLTGSSFLIGIIFQPLVVILKTRVAPVAFVFFLIGFLILSISSSIYWIGGAIVYIGAAMGLLIPLIMDTITKEVPSENTIHALAIINFSLYLGQFISPLIPGFLVYFINIPYTRLPFYVSAAISLISVLALIFAGRAKFEPVYYNYLKKRD